MESKSERIRRRIAEGKEEKGREKGTGGSKGSGNSDTEKGRTGEDGGRTGEAGGRTGEAGEEKEEKLLKLAPVEQPEPAKVKIFAEEKEDKKPRKTRKPRKSVKKNGVNVEQISATIVAVSALVASRPDMGHWMVTKAEADAIAKPLADVIESMGASETLEKYGPQFALVTAIIAVFAPKIFVTVNLKKQRKEKEKIGRKIDGMYNKKAETGRDNPQDSGRNIPTKSDAENNVKHTYPIGPVLA